MARQPGTLTPEQMAEVETLAALLSTEQIADYFGIGRRTFYDMMARDEEIAARYKRGRAKAIGVIAQGLIQKARAGNLTAAIFYLKTQAGWRETDRIEHSGAVIAAVTDARNPAELVRERLDQIARRMAAVNGPGLAHADNVDAETRSAIALPSEGTSR